MVDDIKDDDIRTGELVEFVARAPDTRRIEDYVAAALAERTRKEYRRDLQRFLDWGGGLPASPETIADYLAAHAATHAAATLQRWLVGIGRAHTSQGLPSPTASDRVKATLRGIRREHGSAQRRVAPALRDDVVAMVRALGERPKDTRDRALLLIGFASACRRSELVALRVDDLRFNNEGLTLTLRRSKTDPEGRGRDIGIPYARGPVCPVHALLDWLTLLGLHPDGPFALPRAVPVFRAVSRYGRIADRALGDRAVAEIVKARCRAVGLDPQRYAGHSLRAGFCTSAAQAGKSSWQIRKQSGHKSDTMLNRYIRDGRLFADNPLEGLL